MITPAGLMPCAGRESALVPGAEERPGRLRRRGLGARRGTVVSDFRPLTSKHREARFFEPRSSGVGLRLPQPRGLAVPAGPVPGVAGATRQVAQPAKNRRLTDTGHAAQTLRAPGGCASLGPSLCFAGADMTDQPNRELPPAKRRRLIIAAVLRGLVVTTALVVLYYLLPLDRPWDTGTAVRLLVGLLVFAGLTVWQIRAIVGARYPGLRAAEALV